MIYKIASEKLKWFSTYMENLCDEDFIFSDVLVILW